jgi:folate-binding protein YgfZ
MMLAHLPARAVLYLTGGDRVGFLNGLVSNDVALAAPGRAIWAALLTAQGKWLADFFILATADALLIDCEAAQAEMLASRLTRYKLRADIHLAASPLHVATAWGGTQDLPEGTIAAPDPRLPGAGWRVLCPSLPPATASFDDWDRHRIGLGLPDGSRDLEPEKTVLLEAGFDELNGVSWTKGCYMGQELTARTRYRGLVKRRLVPVSATLPLPDAGTPVFSHDKEVGQIRSSNGSAGLALLRLEALHSNALISNEKSISIHIPPWARIPQAA